MPGRRRHAASRTPRASANSVPGTPTSGRGTNGKVINGEQMCDCKPPLKAVLRETQKPGRNKGRWFYTCPQDRRHQCSMFVWEDYVGAARTAGSQGTPRPTYRTSISQRTTPPAERIGGPATAPRAAGIQRPLPPPPAVSQSTGAGRRRTFAIALDDDCDDDTVMHDTIYISDDEPAPPTPTPVRTRRVSGQVASPPTRSDTRAAARTASRPEPARPGHAAQPKLASTQITKYFGVAKKDQQQLAKKDQQQLAKNNQQQHGVSIKQEIKQEKRDPPSSSELSHFVSSQEQPSSSATTAASGPCSPPPTQAQAQVPTPGSASTVRPAPRSGTLPADYSDSEFDSETDRAMAALADDCEQSIQRKKSREIAARNASTAFGLEDTDMGGEGPRSVIVPVLSASQRITGSGRSSGDAMGTRSSRAAKEAAAASDTTPASEETTDADRGEREFSFADLFYGGRDQPQHLQQQPLPSISVPSLTMASSQTSTVALSQVPDLTQSFATVATSPPSSFRSDAAGPSEPWPDRLTRRKRARDERPLAWYDTQGSSSYGDDGATSVVTANPFDDTSSKRIRFHDAAAVSQRDLTPSSSQSRDHNVTRAVLQLLEGQPVENRVLQQVRALLNTSFEDYEG